MIETGDFTSDARLLCRAVWDTGQRFGIGVPLLLLLGKPLAERGLDLDLIQRPRIVSLTIVLSLFQRVCVVSRRMRQQFSERGFLVLTNTGERLLRLCFIARCSCAHWQVATCVSFVKGSIFF